MLQRITEMNTYREFNLYHEYSKIEELFSSNEIVFFSAKGDMGYNVSISIEDFMKQRFLDWHLRGTFTKLDEMRKAWLINKELLSENYQGITEEQVLIFIQFAWNCLDYFTKALDASSEFSDIQLELVDFGIDTVRALASNMDSLLFHLGAGRYFDEDKTEHVVYYRDGVDDAIAEQHQDIRESLIQYRRIDTVHDLQRKEEILCTLFKKFENFRGGLKAAGFDTLQSDTGFIMNFARHMPHGKDAPATKFHLLSNEDKEKWYDNAYKMFIACLAVLPYIDVKLNIAKLK